ELVEGHGTVDVALLPLGAPDDALVRDLLDDRRLPGPVREEDLRLPLDLGVLLSVDVLDLLHEVRELVELGPLVVGDRDRHADVDGLDDVRRLRRLAAARGAAAATGDLVLEVAGLVLHTGHEALDGAAGR